MSGWLLATSDVQTYVRWQWTLPLGATILLGLLAIVWIALLYTREISRAGTVVRTLLISLRCFAIFLAVVVFAQPTRQWFQVIRPRLVLLIDQSASMQVQDVLQDNGKFAGQVISRRSAIKQLLVDEELMEDLEKSYELDVVAFDTKPTLLTKNEHALSDLLSETGKHQDTTDGTDLASAINYSLRDLPGPVPAVVLLFSDGIATQGPMVSDVLHQVRQLHVPVFTISAGSDEPRPDLALESLLAEEQVFPGDRTQVEATLHAIGCADKSVTVKLLNESDERILAQTEVQIAIDDQQMPISLTILPKNPGKLTLKLIVESDADELNTLNNALQYTMTVSDKKIRTLLVQASPSYEYRALKSLLERDPAIELRILLQEADFEFSQVEQAAIAEFPLGEQELNAYDVVILGDVNPDLLSRQIWPVLEQFVSHNGGGLIAIAGPEFMPMAYRENTVMQKLLPLEFDKSDILASDSTYIIQPTLVGVREASLQLGNTSAESSAIWNQLPPVRWRASGLRTKSSAQVLAAGKGDENNFPMIFRQYVGAGEVLFHATDETWRWRWRTDDRYFVRYWGQAVRRLGRAKLTSNQYGSQLTTNRATYQVGEVVHLQARFRNKVQAANLSDSLDVVIQGEQGSRRQVVLNRRSQQRLVYEADIHDLVPDQYEAQLTVESDKKPTATQFQIQQPPTEMARIATDQQTLQQIATQTGGKMAPLESARAMLSDLPVPQQINKQIQAQKALWNQHWVMAVFATTLCAEWLIRRRYSML